MKEKELIQTIKTILNSEYIGDDCAYLKDEYITVSQDSLVEDVHFSLKYITAYKLGWKSVMVNISDICASGARPKYLTIALSLPDYINEKFVKDFYMGAKDAAKDVEIVGGDITGSDKLYISVTAIGSTKNMKISSRKNAKPDFAVIVSGELGNSAMGLKILSGEKHFSDIKLEQFFINSHLMPEAQRDFSKQIASTIGCDYAMMDTSDGLCDALIQIAQSSNLTISVDTSKIPHNEFVDMDTVLYGGEDYQLVAVVPENILNRLSNYYLIGKAKKGFSGIEIDGKFYFNIDDKIFNHFKK